MTDAGMAWPPVRAARGTVLVVDNGRTLTGEIGPALEGAGYRVLAATPLEALGMAHEVQPDVEGGAGGRIRPRGGVMPARGPARRPRPILS